MSRPLGSLVTLTLDGRPAGWESCTLGHRRCRRSAGRARGGLPTPNRRRVCFRRACDDTVPPETAISAVSTAPNAGGWGGDQHDDAFAFAGAHTDADTDPLAFECKLDGPAAGP